MKRILSMILCVMLLLSTAVTTTVFAETIQGTLNTEGMPEVTDFSEYDLVKSVDTKELARDAYAFYDVNLTGDYVLTFDYTTGSTMGNAGEQFAIHAGGNIIRFRTNNYAYNTIFEESYDTTAYNAGKIATTWEDTYVSGAPLDTFANADVKYGYSGFGEDTLNTTYNIYFEKTGDKVIFGIKKSGVEANYSWLKTTAINAIAAEDIVLRNVITGGVTLSNIKIYDKKVPMNEITDLEGSGYKLYKNVATKTINDTSDGIQTNMNWFIDTNMTGDYVIKFKLATKAIANPTTNSAFTNGSRIDIHVGGNIVSLLPKLDEIRYDGYDKNAYLAPYTGDRYNAADLNVGNTNDTGYHYANTAQKKCDYTFGIAAAAQHDVYIAKNGNEFIFGIRRSGTTEYTYFTVAAKAVEPADFLMRNCIPTIDGNKNDITLTDYQVWAKEVYDPGKSESELAANYDVVNKADNTLAAHGHAFYNTNLTGDYILTFDYNFDSVTGVNDTERLEIHAGGNIIKLLNAYKAIYHKAYDTTAYVESDMAAQPSKYTDSINDNWQQADLTYGYSFEQSDDSVDYKVYLEKSGDKLIFKIKKSTDNFHAYFTTTAKNTIENEDIVLRSQTDQGVVLKNIKIYEPKTYVADIDYTKSANTVTVNLDLTAHKSEAAPTAVFVTAVYKKSGDVIQMTDASATEVKALALGVKVDFENTVDIPTLAAGETYEVKSFLWKSFDDVTPLMSEFVME